MTLTKEKVIPIKLSVGLARTVGNARGGSVGASCHLELELNGLLLDHDPAALHSQVRRAYASCAQVVAEELTTQQRSTPRPTQSRAASDRVPDQRPTSDAARDAVRDDLVQNGQLATGRPMDYLRRLAGNVVRPASERASCPSGATDDTTDRECVDTPANRRFGHPREGLSTREADRVIDRLRAALGGCLVDALEPKAGEASGDADAADGAAGTAGTARGYLDKWF